MTYPVRVDLDPSPMIAFSSEEIASLDPRATTPKPARQAWTLRDALPANGQTSMVLGRTSDGEPGVKTLWCGYRP